MKNFIIALLICVGCSLAKNRCLDHAYEIINSLEKCEVFANDADGVLFICSGNVQLIKRIDRELHVEYTTQGNHYRAIISLGANECFCWASDEFGITIPYSDSKTKLSEKETWDIYAYFKEILHNKNKKTARHLGKMPTAGAKQAGILKGGII